MYDFLIVGCGLAGMTASRALAEKGYKVVLVEKRNHIGGNIYDYYNQAGILLHKYGPHIFHTNEKIAWDFLSRFTQWREYQHRVLSYVNGKFVPMPINLDTINMLYGTSYDALTFKDYINNIRENVITVTNSKEYLISQVGQEIYRLFYENYTKKQWDLFPDELSSEVAARVPIRYNRDNRYFTDRYQGIPKSGYTQMSENILDHKNIKILLNATYDEIKNEISFSKLIYTGCIEHFMGEKYGELPYRSLNFIEETYDTAFYQQTAVVNYPNDYDYTRITEYKLITGQKHEKTTIVKEISGPAGEPFYPVPTPQNKARYQKYRDESNKSENVFFLGRLGTYSYMNMDAVILQALGFCHTIPPKNTQDISGHVCPV